MISTLGEEKLQSWKHNNQNISEVYFLIIQATTADFTESPTKGRKRAIKSKLPKELQGLMGEANMKFARGEYHEVIMMCQEIIKLGEKKY